MSTVKENLIAAKALIDTPEKWGKGSGSFMPDSFGAPLCILGACNRAHVTHDIEDALRAQIPDEFSRSFIRFNDHPKTTHADIMALFDRAIAAQDGA